MIESNQIAFLISIIFKYIIKNKNLYNFFLYVVIGFYFRDIYKKCYYYIKLIYSPIRNKIYVIYMIHIFSIVYINIYKNKKKTKQTIYNE